MKVYLRLHPGLYGDAVASYPCTAKSNSNGNAIDNETIQFKSISGIGKMNSSDHISFKFTKLFKESVTQSEMATYFVDDIVDNLFNGFNVSLITYGGNETGKTYTLIGSPGINQGLLPRLLTKIFNKTSNIENNNADVSNNNLSHSIHLRFTILDIQSNNTITDLLSTDNINKNMDYSNVTHDSIPSYPISSIHEILSSISQARGSLFIRLSIQQIINNTLINSNLTISELNTSSSDENITNLEKMLKKNKNCSNISNTKFPLNNLLRDSLLNINNITHLILTASSSPIAQDETLRTLTFGQLCLKLDNNNDLLHSNQSIVNLKKLLESVNNLSNINSLSYDNKIDYLNKRIKNNKEMNKNVIITNNIEEENDLNSKIENENKDLNEQIDDIITQNFPDKESIIESLISKINQLHQLTENESLLKRDNHFKSNEVDTITNFENNLNLINSNLLDNINSQEINTQKILSSNISLKEQLNTMKQKYLENIETLNSLENSLHLSDLKISNNNNALHKSVSSNTSSVNSSTSRNNTIEGNSRLIARNSMAFQNSINSATTGTSSLNSRSPHKSMPKSNSGFNLQVLKSND